MSQYPYPVKIKQELAQIIQTDLEIWLANHGPNWAEPFVTLDSKGNGFYVSLTEDFEHDKLLSWSNFIEQQKCPEFASITAAKKHLKNVKKLVKMLEFEIQQMEKHERKT
jgi:hypothetical protein